MEMEWASIELKVRDCRDLRAFNFFQKLSVYVVVSIIQDDVKKNQKHKPVHHQKTPIGRYGDGNYEWNHVMHFDVKDMSLLDCSQLWVKFQLRCEGIIYGNKTIGVVCVPLKDLMDESNEAVRFVSYQVRTTDGKPNGVLNFSYKLLDKAKKTTSGSDVSPRLQFPSNIDNGKIQYPTVEVDDNSTPLPGPRVRYPWVDVVHFPLPGFQFPTTHEAYYQAAELCDMRPSCPCPWPHAACYINPASLPPHSSMVGSMSCGPLGYPGFGQGDAWRLPAGGDGFPGVWTGR